MEKSKADLAASNARTIEVEAEMELAVAKPALMAAQEAVNCLDKASLTELKSFSKVNECLVYLTTPVQLLLKSIFPWWGTLQFIMCATLCPPARAFRQYNE